MTPVTIPTNGLRAAARHIRGTPGPEPAGPEPEIWLGVPDDVSGPTGRGYQRHGSNRAVGGVPVFGTAHGPRLLELID